jgi:hypothetical protein
MLYLPPWINLSSVPYQDPNTISERIPSPRGAFRGGPWICFNQKLICEGESLKGRVVVKNTRVREQPAIVIHPFDEKSSETFEMHIRIRDREDFVGVRGWEFKGLLKQGSYRLEVRLPLTRRDGSYETLARHEFIVLPKSEYAAIWSQLFGESWDEPLYWDRLAPTRLVELLKAIGIDFLLPDSLARLSSFAKTTDFLGRLVVALMAGETHFLPFKLRTETIGTARIPHLDLIKLVWLLNVLMPFWTDYAFSASDATLTYAVEGQRVFFRLNFEESSGTFLNDTANIGSPYIYDVVGQRHLPFVAAFEPYSLQLVVRA